MDYTWAWEYEEENRSNIPTVTNITQHRPINGIMDWNKQLERLFEEKSFCDVTINIKGTELSANKFVLAARSPVFEAMFNTNCIEKELNYVQVNDVEPKVFNEFLRFLYTNNVEDWQTMAEKLLPLADKYLVDDLIRQCQPYIIDQLTVDNCLDLLILADRPTTPSLKKVISSFVECQQPGFVTTPKE